MGLGFLALAEMEFLSLRLKQRAELGTQATNMIQFVSDRDLGEVRRAFLLNSAAYLDAKEGRAPNLDYCSGGAGSICGACPCNPLQALTPNPTNGTVNEATCAAIDADNLDFTSLEFRTTGEECDNDAALIRAVNGSVLYVVKQATTTQVQLNGVDTITVSIACAVKTQAQVSREISREGDGFSVALRDSLASQVYQVSAHIDTDSEKYSDIGWNQVIVPHIP